MPLWLRGKIRKVAKCRFYAERIPVDKDRSQENKINGFVDKHLKNTKRKEKSTVLN